MISGMLWLLAELAGPVAGPLPAQGTMPIPLDSPATWIASYDYPALALRNREEGPVGVALEVAADGRVTACSITASSKSPSLDEATCRLIATRARFSPGRSPDGAARSAPYRTRVVWKIPTAAPQPVARTVVSTFIVETDGRMTNCVFETAQNVDPAELARRPSPCQGGMRTTPFVDTNGAPVRKLVRIRQSIEIEATP